MDVAAGRGTGVALPAAKEITGCEKVVHTADRRHTLPFLHADSAEPPRRADRPNSARERPLSNRSDALLVVVFLNHDRFAFLTRAARRRLRHRLHPITSALLPVQLVELSVRVRGEMDQRHDVAPRPDGALRTG
jgi:hypothetical protein